MGSSKDTQLNDVETNKEEIPPVPDDWTRCVRSTTASPKDTQPNDEEDAIPPVPNGWTRCHAYVPRKQRFCRQVPLPDASYCGNHRAHLKESSTRVRIPCPLDPRHSIYEDALERHLKICPVVRLRREQEERPYYRSDVNAGGHGRRTTAGDDDDDTPLTMEQAKELALAVLRVHQRLFTDITLEDGDLLKLSSSEIESALPLKDLSAPELEAGLARAVEGYHIRSGGPKHLRQQASLLGHLRRLAPSEATSYTVLELGAGRGMLGLVAAGALAATCPEVDLVMVERAGTRSKADTVLRNHQSKLEGPSRLAIERVARWSRIQCDLSHVHMPTVLPGKKSSSDAKPVVLAIAKHLCGAGTDLALKALYPVRDQIQVCMMATCCHGVCTWEHYVGRDYLREVLGDDPHARFGPAQFELLRFWSSSSVLKNAAATPSSPERKKLKPNDERDDDGAHGETRVADPDDPRAAGAKAVASALDLACGAQGLGRACQRLLDYGRQQYVERVLFADDAGARAELCHYVPSSVTPQNAVLMSSRSGTTATTPR